LSLGDNYTLTVTPNTLKITPATLTIKANDLTWYTDRQKPLQTDYSRTISGFKFADANNNTLTSGITTTYSTTYSFGSKSNIYPISPVSTSSPVLTNYTIKDENGNLYVNDAKAKKITTTLKCVEKLVTPVIINNETYTYKAKFLYDNPNNTDVYVPLSDTRNFVSGNGKFDRTNPPPTIFYKNEPIGYDLLFDGNLVTWVLVTNSLNSSTTATSSPSASSTSIKCSTLPGNTANQLPVDAQLVDGISTEKYAVYPNPVTNRLMVSSALQSLKATDISIYDLQGKLYRVSSSRQVSTNKVELDLGNMAAGVYMVRIQSNSETKVFRIVKE
jgi:hypothetical protein